MWVRPWLLQTDLRHSRIHQFHEDDPRILWNDKDQTGTTSSQAGHHLQSSNQCWGKVGPHHQIAGYWRVIHIILSCQFRFGRTSISKFLPEVCRAMQDEFTREYLRCPTTPDEWKELEMEFRIRWNIPHALGALDGNHVALKKPTRTLEPCTTTIRDSFQ